MAELAAGDAGTETVVADTNSLVLEGIGKVVFALGHGTDKDADALVGAQGVDVISDSDDVGIETQRHFPAVRRKVPVQELDHKTSKTLERSGNSNGWAHFDQDAFGGVDVDLQFSGLVDGRVEEGQKTLDVEGLGPNLMSDVGSGVADVSTHLAHDTNVLITVSRLALDNTTMSRFVSLSLEGMGTNVGESELSVIHAERTMRGQMAKDRLVQRSRRAWPTLWHDMGCSNGSHDQPQSECGEGRFLDNSDHSCRQGCLPGRNCRCMTVVVVFVGLSDLSSPASPYCLHPTFSSVLSPLQLDHVENDAVNPRSPSVEAKLVSFDKEISCSECFIKVFGLAIIGISGPLTAVLLRKQTHVHPYKDTSLPSSQATVQQASESTSLKSK
ncbi:hypothetical protein KCU88_g352, partial [Aureobasidium melanogenum]